MGETTHISWADRTFSPWTGCTKISPACDGCYAAHLMDTRMHRVEWGEPGAGEGTRSLMSDSYWRQPLAWNREAERTGVRPWVFPSLCDPLDLAVEDSWHARFHETILRTPNVFWLMLSKRIGNVKKVADLGGGRLYSATNWAAGATFANQHEWNRDGWKLREAGRAFDALTFASFEPLLSGIRFDQAIHDNGWLPDWVIAGGETDQGAHKARPSHPDWFRSLRDQSSAAGVAFHFKQWGEWAPHRTVPGGDLGGDMRADRARFVQGDERRAGGHFRKGDAVVARLGKRAAGRSLDGAVHDARPDVRP